MSEYDFILDNLFFSFSSATTFENCKYGFYLTYIQAEDRKQNFFAEFGLTCHEVLEKYFKGEIDISGMIEAYEEIYPRTVISPAPAFMKDAYQSYYDKGLTYFQEFNFNKDDYDVILIEEAIKLNYNNINLTVKPDLVLREKSTGKNILIDFKTANVYKNDKLDKKKFEGYLKQFYLYAKFLWESKGIAVDEIHVWFIVNNKVEKVIFDPFKAEEVTEWFLGVVNNIYETKEWEYNNSNPFFCNNLCSVADACQYRP